MENWHRFLRVILFLALLICLLAGLSAPASLDETVNAAPMSAVSPGDVVISEFRTTGPNGANDEFVELHNPKNVPVDISGLLIKGSNSAGATGNRYQIPPSPPSTILQPGQYYLLVGSAYSGTTTGDPSAIAPASTTDDGGFAIVDGTTIIDAVGMSSGSAYKEGTILTPLSGTAEQSYERKNNGCTDTNDNGADFIWNQTSSNPQNLSSILISCLRVINVTSPTVDGNYIVGALPIAVTVTFSSNVDVTGAPTLLLETGTTDRNATYVSGSGTSTLTFNYTVQAGDVSSDLDYVGPNSLSLNGGTIIGAIGDANLTLPIPGMAGSLGFNKAIVIDNQVPPSLVSFTRLNPASQRTNADTLVFRATFSEAVTGVDPADFVVHTNATPPTTTALVTGVSPSPISVNSTYDVTISGGDLAGILYNGDVGLDLSAAPSISDVTANPLPIVEPTIDEIYTVDNIVPTVTVDQAASQADPASGTPINFTVVFSEPINPSTFTVGDITQNGTVAASLITWNITDSGDHITFTLSATSVRGIPIPPTAATLVPSIDVNKALDVAGNANIAASTNTDNVVTFNDNVPPTVTVNQTGAQVDPTNTLPINFAVVFSEPIILFATADIKQNGTATGITWSITNSGDDMTFTLSATAVTGAGTLIPSIDANKVTDYIGNNNTASTSTDNTVVYETTGPTVTVDQAVGQADPTSVLPINFTVVFSEPIIVSTFTSADINQTGTATGITWVIADSGDHKTFTLSATTLTANGTLRPSILANQVTDVAGNSNSASTSTDNTVTSNATLPTPTRTASPTLTPALTSTSIPTLTLFINEVAWAGTAASANDEWIELYNPGTTDINLTGWTLKTDSGSVKITWTASDINTDFVIEADSYYLIERDSDNFTVSDIDYDKSFTGALSNSGEILRLISPSDQLVDIANFDGGAWPAGSATTFSSMERYGSRQDGVASWVTNTGVVKNGKGLDAGIPNGCTASVNCTTNPKEIFGTPKEANWASTVTITPSPTPVGTRTPTRAPTSTAPPPVGRPVINEFLPRPGFDWNQDGKVNVYDEFIEVTNNGNADISLSGWKLDDEANSGSNPFTLPAVTLKIGEHMVFYGLQTNILLSDGGDTVRLLNPGGKIYDAYTYSIAKVEDQSVCRLPDGKGSWYEDCSPTPNFTNAHSGSVPSMPGGDAFESPVCSLPDTLPADFLFAECRGFGANIWDSFYWDKSGWQGVLYILEKTSRWESFVE